MIKLINDTINEKDIDQLVEWLQTYPRLTKGPITLEFEKKWAKWLGMGYAVYCNSGSSANLLMLYALIRSGRLKNNKIVIPGLAWATDLAPAIQLNYEPILCDINMDNLSVDLEMLEELFKTESPSVFLSVSVLGLSPDLNAIEDLCHQYGVILLEDNCESMGSEFQGIRLGNFGEMTSFSLYFGHHISTIEGGMVCTDDKELYDILLSIRSHGWDRDWDPDKREYNRLAHGISEFNSLYTFYHPGFNVRSTDLQAFIGIGQLDKIDNFTGARVKTFDIYQDRINNTYWKPNPLDDTLTSNFAYPIIHPERDKIAKALQEVNVECRPLICGTMGRQPFYTEVYGVKALKNCDIVDEFGMYIPNHPALSNDDLDLIINTINKITG